MRVTTQMAASNLVSNLNRSYQRVVRFQNELASGSRLNRLSDDPAAVQRSLALRSELRHIEQFDRNIQDGIGWLGLAEKALSDLETLFMEARGLAIQGASSTYNAAQRQAMANQIDQSLEHALALSESRHLGNYIFSGTRTSAPPYVARRGADGSVIGVEANGDIQGVINREISAGIVVPVNVPGSEVFSSPPDVTIPLGVVPDHLNPTDVDKLRELFGDDARITLDELTDFLQSTAPDADEKSPELEAHLREMRDRYATRQTNPFTALIELRDALRQDDTDAVRGTLGTLASMRDRFSTIRGSVGSRVQRLESTRGMLERVAGEMKSILADTEAVDIAATVVNLSQEQDILQAALASSNALMSRTLMDYI